MPKFSVYQHWDPLRACVVGRSYPPEFYSWIKTPHVRKLFEKMAMETEEDYQGIVKKLQEFGVQVIRPDLPSAEDCFVDGRYLSPPMNPRDNMIMIGDVFYEQISFDFANFYRNVKSESWPDRDNIKDFENLPDHIKNECNEIHKLDSLRRGFGSYDRVFDLVSAQGNTIKHHWNPGSGAFVAPGSMISRIGRDLYFGTADYNERPELYIDKINAEFPQYRNHIVNTGGHADSTYCPVCPGLIISLHDVPTYKNTFPDWEVVYLPKQSWNLIEDFTRLKAKNNGKWWIPGFEHDQAVLDTVESWMSHWTGYVEETVFDVNMLIVDPKNVIVFSYNKQVFDALDRYGITPHVVPFRHRYFWDGGIHCVTADLHREGTMQDFFPNRES
jgi:hypothetical protein